MVASRKTFFILACITLFGFSFVGYIIIYFFQDEPFINLFLIGKSWWYQIFRGLLFGGIAALNLLWIIRTPLLKESREFFTQLIKESKIQIPDILFLSFAAGVGEEILFRGAIQPFLGIWITAIIFVALHGYLNPSNLRMSIYGILMIVVSAGLGYLFDRYGIISAITAHFFIDVVLFVKFRYFS